MSVALAAVGKAGTDRDDLNVCTVIADVVPNLLKAAQGREITNRIDENRISAKCDPAATPAMFCSATPDIDVPFGKTRSKWFQHRVPQVTREQPNFRILRGQLLKVAMKLFLMSPISAKAAFSCSSDGDL